MAGHPTGFLPYPPSGIRPPPRSCLFLGLSFCTGIGMGGSTSLAAPFLFTIPQLWQAPVFSAH